ncbi:hypothetical protein [Paraburkholderia sp. SIMBA_054]|uniref:hypothetical protein n=1 Tax=Paraburkholderia sp. SIMBA_054 TaxID=3085795 RepID=UPI003978CDEE
MKTRFMTCKGRAFNHVPNDSGENCEHWYEDTETGRQFDVRELPTAYLGADRADVLAGCQDAQRRAIRRALANGHDFRRMI